MTRIAAGLVALVAGTTMQAEIITVTTDSGGTGGPDCTLRDAMTAANTDLKTGGCPGGSGADTIKSPDGVTITLTEVDNNAQGPNGLPSITSEITVNGNGATIERDSADEFRIFFVAAAGVVILDNLTVTGGAAPDGLFKEGGGGIQNDGTLTLTGSTVSGNTADKGGGIENFNTVTLIGSTVSGNTANGVFAEGGGIDHIAGTMTLTDSAVNGNSAADFGGGIANFSTMTLTDCTVSENSAVASGGGIENLDGTLTLTNTTVSGNEAGSFGGGIQNFGGTLTLTISTVSGNVTDSNGGGILNFGTVTMTNSIVANSLLGGDCVNTAGTFNDDGFNIGEDGTCIDCDDPTIHCEDPALGDLADNGGPTETHALLAGSIAIDNGDCADGTITEDQRGLARPQGPECDIGSFELECVPPVIVCPGDVTVERDESIKRKNTGEPEVSEGCGQVAVEFEDDVTKGDCPQEFSITRTFTATDDNGDAVSCEQTITVVDTTEPVLVVPPNVTIECDESDQPDNTGLAQAADNCDDKPAITFEDDVAVGGCPQEVTITRTWTATDDCGNAVSQDQIITVIDTTAPGLTVPPDVTIECDESDQPDNTGEATGADNCDDTPLVEFDDKIARGDCPQESVITRTWTATDGCRNATSLVQIITIVDTTAPDLMIPADVTIECDESDQPDNTGEAIAKDNCDSRPAISFEDDVAAGDCPQESIITRAWTAIDACGNDVSMDQVITVEGSTPPEITCPPDVTVAGGESTEPEDTGAATAVDNCDDAVDISFSDRIIESDCAADPVQTVIERTWTATDDCDNSSTCLQLITVLRRHTLRGLVAVPMPLPVE